MSQVELACGAGLAKLGPIHDTPDSLFKVSSLALLSIHEDQSQCFPVKLDNGSEAIVEAVAHEAVSKIARAIISWHGMKMSDRRHTMFVLHCRTSESLSTLFQLFWPNCVVILQVKEQGTKWLHETISAKEFTRGAVVKSHGAQDETHLLWLKIK